MYSKAATLPDTAWVVPRFCVGQGGAQITSIIRSAFVKPWPCKETEEQN